MPIDPERTFKPIRIALLTLSDTRTPATDTSGDILAERITTKGHTIAARAIAREDVPAVVAHLSGWLDDPAIDCIITTGGTGLTGRDLIPEAVLPLLERVTDGFGELFRWLSYEDIGASALQSRALAGSANGRFVFCLPGSRGACELGWDKIIGLQLNTETRPCNLAELLPRLREPADRPAGAKRPSRRD